MSREYSVQPGSSADRRRDAAVHVTPLIPAAAAVVVIGRPALWAAPVTVGCRRDPDARARCRQEASDSGHRLQRKRRARCIGLVGSSGTWHTNRVARHPRAGRRAAAVTAVAELAADDRDFCEPGEIRRAVRTAVGRAVRALERRTKPTDKSEGECTWRRLSSLS